MTILIGGGSCSGKTTLAQALANHLNIPQITLDKFFRRDDPKAPQITLNNQLLFDCNHPETINLNQALDTIAQTPGPKVIEGHFALTYPQLRNLATLQIFIDCPPDIREQRRINRDSPKKGTPEEVLAYYQTSAVPGFINYIEPSKAHADIVLDGTQKIASNIEIIEKWRPRRDSNARPTA